MYTNTKQLSSFFPPGQDSAHYVMGGEEVGVGKGDGWGAYPWGCVSGGCLGPAADELQTSCQNFFFPLLLLLRLPLLLPLL